MQQIMKYFRIIFTLLLCSVISQISSAQTPSPSTEMDLEEQVTIYYEEENYTKTIELLEILIDKYKPQKEGTADSSYINYSMDLAAVYNEMGQSEKAITAFESIKAYLLSSNREKDSRMEEIRRSLFTLYNSIGDLDKAELELLAALQLEKQKSENSLVLGKMLNTLGYLYIDLNRFSEAESHLLEAQKIIERQLGTDDPNYVSILNNLGALYNSRGDFEKAKKYAQKTATIYKRVLGENSMQYAMALDNLAVVHGQLEQYEKSGALFEEALTIKKENLPPNHPAIAQSYYYLGVFNRFNKNFEKAEQYSLKSLEFKAAILPKTAPAYILDLNNLAILYAEMGRFEDARNYLQKAIQLSTGLDIGLDLNEQWIRQILEQDDLSLVHLNALQTSLSYFYELLANEKAEGFKEKQLLLSNLALTLLDNIRTQYSNNQDALAVLAESNKWVLEGMKVLELETQVEEAFEMAEQSKAVLLQEATQASRKESFGEISPEMLQKEEALYEQREQLSAKLLEVKATTKDSLRTRFNQLNLEIDAFRKELSQQYPRYFELKTQKKQTQIADIQKNLAANTVFLEYVVGKDQVYIIYIDKDKAKVYTAGISNDSLKSKIKQFHQILSDYAALSGNSNSTKAAYIELANWFYQELLDQSLGQSDQIEKLILITDAELGHLPFEAFLTKKPAAEASYAEFDYLIKKYQVSYNYSANLWVLNKNQSQKQTSGQMLGLAADYEAVVSDSLQLISRAPVYQQIRSILQPLPAAKEEIITLSNSYQGVFNSSATEAFFKANAGDYSIIHLAMHGLLNKEDPILSSLAFTENGDSLENNFLQAYEISKMELNANLVVLSACETGYGRFETGNGIASLARAFMYAGVPSLVVSLWQVNDQSTSIMMQNFYKHLASGMTKSAALRQAKLDYIEKVDNPIAAHPAFWSPFILIGDEAPVKLQRKGGSIPYWGWALAVGLLVLVVGGIWSWRARRAIS
jgi:CHAT domain-containing protein/Flp pilus assembly protein TadD